jgi:hypothetical protein
MTPRSEVMAVFEKAGKLKFDANLECDNINDTRLYQYKPFASYLLIFSTLISVFTLAANHDIKHPAAPS